MSEQVKERGILFSVVTGQPSQRGKRLQSADGLTWKERNRAAVNARRRVLYEQDLQKHRDRASAYRKANAERVRDINRPWLAAYRARIRAEMIAVFGGKCACCGESQPEFMQLDHVFNDGAKERREERAAAHVFWARLKKRGWPKERYQLLCANCNFGKRMNGGVCPHAK